MTSGVTDFPVQAPRHQLVGKPASWSSRGVMRRSYGTEGSRFFGREKPLGSLRESVPQSATGRRVEYTQVGEITLVKELGKMSPYVRKKGSPGNWAAESRLGRLFIKNTAPCQPERGCIGSETWPLLEGQGEACERRTEAPAKAGRNYNGPKVNSHSLP